MCGVRLLQLNPVSGIHEWLFRHLFPIFCFIFKFKFPATHMSTRQIFVYATIDWPPDRLLQCLINAYCTGTSTGTVPTLFFFCSASSMAASFIRMSDISLARAHIIGLRLSRSAPAHGRYKNPLRSGREALHRFYLRPFFPSSF